MTGTFCWWCGRALQGPGVLVKDQIGNEQGVHEVCRSSALESFTQAMRMHVEEKRWSSFDSIDEDD